MLEALEGRICLSAPSQWNSRGPGGGGAFFAPSFSPFNSSELYTVTDMSGVFHSTNTGASWQLQSFKQLQGNRPSRVQFTSDPNVRYILDTSELADGSEPNVPKRSADGGATWTPVSGWDPGNQAFSVYADWNNTTNLVVSDYSSIYFSNNGAASFTMKYTAPSDGLGVYVAGAFFDGANIYLGTNRGLIVSNNSGSSFAISGVTGIPSNQAIFSFAGAKQGSTTRFFAVTLSQTSGNVYPGTLIEDVKDQYTGIYSIDVGQSNWSAKTTGIPAGNYPSFISMARNDISTAYVAGGSSLGVPTVSKTTNGGGNWSTVLNTTNNTNVATGWQGQGGDRGWGFGELAMDFQVAPLDATHAAWTDFGFVHLTTNGGTTWSQAYVNPADQNAVGVNTPAHKAYRGVGLEDTSALWLNWSDANNLQAGYTDIIGVRSTDGGSSWSFPTFPAGQNTFYSIVKNISISTLYAAASATHDIYQSTHLTDATLDNGKGWVHFSTDNGATWQIMHDFGHPVVWVAVDPTNANRLYASVVSSTAGGIYTTTNANNGAASTWTKVADPPRTQGHPYDIRVLNNGDLVATYSARRGTVNGVTSFTASSGVFLSTDNGATWADRTLMGTTNPAVPGMQYWTKDITIDPTDANQNTWWAAVRSGYGGNGNGWGGLYKTTDRGLHWTRVFSADSVESVTINPATTEIYVSTTDSGLWYAADATSASLAFTQTTYPFRQPERIFINPFNTKEVWVSSFGYGLTVGTVAAAPPKISAANFNFQTTHSIILQFSADVSATVDDGDLMVKNTATNAIIPAHVVNNGTSATITFPGNMPLPNGNYTLAITAAGVSGAGGQLDGNGDGVGGDDYSFGFFFLAGDADRNKAVNTADFTLLAQNFGKSAATFSQGDFNYDGTVNALDFNVLANNFGRTLPSPPIAAPLLFQAPQNRFADAQIPVLT